MAKEDRRQIAVEIRRVLKDLAALRSEKGEREVRILRVKRGNSSVLIPTHLSPEGIRADTLPLLRRGGE